MEFFKPCLYIFEFCFNILGGVDKWLLETWQVWNSSYENEAKEYLEDKLWEKFS